jgi:hypothetical protein
MTLKPMNGRDLSLVAQPVTGVVPRYIAFGARQDDGDPLIYVCIERDGKVTYPYRDGLGMDFDPLLFASLLLWLRLQGVEIAEQGVQLLAEAGAFGGDPGKVVFTAPTGSLTLAHDGGSNPNPTVDLVQWVISALMGLA